MQVVILCGGRGTRLGAETEVRPKPMVGIGSMPILWHIMKYYAHFGHRDFVLCLGYKGEIIKEYFLNYEAMQNDVTVELGERPGITYHSAHEEQGWRVTLADTGLETNTGARLKRVQKYLGSEGFMLTYGDGVSNVDLGRLAELHRSHGKIATVTAVHPPARFGELDLAEGKVRVFAEKPQTSAGLINGGFFVFDRRIRDYLPDNEDLSLEGQVLSRLAADGELMAWEHDGFWQCVDTARELNVLRDLWDSGRAPWKVW